MGPLVAASRRITAADFAAQSMVPERHPPRQSSPASARGIVHPGARVAGISSVARQTRRGRRRKVFCSRGSSILEIPLHVDGARFAGSDGARRSVAHCGHSGQRRSTVLARGGCRLLGAIREAHRAFNQPPARNRGHPFVWRRSSTARIHQNHRAPAGAFTDLRRLLFAGQFGLRALPVPGADGEMEMKEMTKLECRIPKEDRKAFTLMELLVVIAIIAVLLGLAFPVFQGVLDRAKKVQAKNDVTQIVTAVNAFYTEYGKYPTVTADTIITSTSSPSNADLMYTLRAVSGGNAINTRQIVFISPPDVKNPANPRSGIGTTTGAGQYYDPWGTPYLVEIDGNYDNQIANPYTANAGATPHLQIGVIAWSLGKDKAGATAAASGDKKTGTYNDDVISWQ